MKKITLFLLFPVFCLAQKKELVYKKLANITCECATRNPNEKMTDLSLGVCIFEALDKLEPKEQKTIGYNSEKKMESIEGVAENVGIEMALICPTVFENLQNDEITDENVDEAIEDTFHVGIIESITSNEFITISIIDETNIKKEFIWLFSFEGDALFIKNKAVKGDKVEIHYREQQFFDPKTNNYKAYNEITEIKLL